MEHISARISRLGIVPLPNAWVFVERGLTDMHKKPGAGEVDWSALSETPDVYRQLFDNAQVGLYRTKLDGSAFLVVNQKLAEIFGYSVDELLKMTPSHLWADAAEREEMIRRVIQEGVLSNYEISIRTATGEQKTALASIKHWPDRGYIEGTAIDITKFKQAELEFRKSTEMWQFVVENSPDFIALLDLDCKIRFINSTLRPAAPTDIIGQSVFNYIAEESLPDVRRCLESVINTGVADKYEARISFSEGGSRYYETRVAALRRDERIELLILDSSDISDRKRTEEELRKFKAISDSAPYGTAIADMQGNLLYVNDAFAAMHGYAPQEVLGKHLSVFHTSAQMTQVNRINELMAGGGSYVGQEVWHVKADGTEFPALMNGVVITDEHGVAQFLSATAIDITDRKRTDDLLTMATEQLEIEREALERKNVALSEILAQIDKEKNDLQRRIVTNIEKAIIPTLSRLKETAPPIHHRNFELLEKDLLDITSPFLDRMKNVDPRLTPREVETCRMIKSGMTSKEIAAALKLSVGTVHKYREKIRRKLNLAGEEVNLQVFLESME